MIGGVISPAPSFDRAWTIVTQTLQRRSAEELRCEHGLHNLIGLIELRPVFSFERRQRCVWKVRTDILGDR